MRLVLRINAIKTRLSVIAIKTRLSVSAIKTRLSVSAIKTRLWSELLCVEWDIKLLLTDCVTVVDRWLYVVFTRWRFDTIIDVCVTLMATEWRESDGTDVGHRDRKDSTVRAVDFSDVALNSWWFFTSHWFLRYYSWSIVNYLSN